MTETKSTNQLVAELERQGEDFEWYPTTQEIVDCLAKKITEKLTYNKGEYNCTCDSILDIGCGNGSFFKKLDATEPQKFNKAHGYHSLFNTRYGIEKSYVLYEQLPDDIVLLGSDFYEQTLIDKKVGLIFCNPPYSDYEAWAEKIIMQGNCKAIALVIPCRWKDSERIAYALKKRNMEAETLGSFDFNNAERRARAKVDLLYITYKAETVGLQGHRYVEEFSTDPFDVWFSETFKINADKEEIPEYRRNEQKRNELVEKGDTAEMLVQFYNADMEKLYANYRQLESLDADIFRELKVDIPNLKQGLKQRISGLKHVYWDMLFKKYDRITRRLTSTGRRRVIEKLHDNTAIDFTLNNIFQLTLWLIKNSNTMFDKQITDFFYSLCNAETIHRYKSNLRWNDDDWRYIKDGFKGWRMDVEKHKKTLKNIRLDYRIVVQAYSNFDTSWSDTRMTDDCYEFLDDIYIIAQNLGFNVVGVLPSDRRTSIDRWRNFDVYQTDGTPFANIKLYKNGNRHVKFCKPFMQKLNVEMARINGWVRDKSQAMEELDISAEDMTRIWGSNYKILPQSEMRLLGLPNAG